MRGPETRIVRHGPCQQPDRHGIVRPSLVPDPNLAAEVAVVRCEIVRRRGPQPLLLSGGQGQPPRPRAGRSEEHTAEIPSRLDIVLRPLLAKKKNMQPYA